jgi:hypothetical protein
LLLTGGGRTVVFGIGGKRIEAVGIEPDNRGYETRATDKGYSQEYGRIQKTAYSHEAMIDLIIANPRITQNQLASEFGYSVGWVSRVMGSDAFQAALARRRDEVTDPFIIASLEEKFKGLVNQSVEILMNKLDATQSADLAIKTSGFGVEGAWLWCTRKEPNECSE